MVSPKGSHAYGNKESTYKNKGIWMHLQTIEESLLGLLLQRKIAK